MNHIEQAIANLIYQHDCVIIPGLGGFVASYRPAYIDMKTNQFFPPSKSLLFNKNLIQNDGLLANSLSNLTSVSYSEANQEIDFFVNQLKNSLATVNRFELPQIGTFFLNEEKSILFKQSKTNFLTQSFGLGSMIANPIIEEEILFVDPNTIENSQKEVPVVIPVSIDRKTSVQTRSIPLEIEAQPKENKKRRKTIYFVLPMLFAGVIGYSVMIADNTQYFQKTPMQISDFNPFSRFSTPEINAYKSISREIDYTHFEMESLDDFIEKYQPIIELEEDVFEDVEKENRFSKPVENSKNDELKYHVVIGCFSEEENASKLVDAYSNEGYSSHIIDQKGGLYRVAIESYQTRDEAKSSMKKIKSTQGISAWVLKK